MVKFGNKGTYKHAEAESTKVYDIVLYRNLPTGPNNSFANGQYRGTFLHCRDGGTHRNVLIDLEKETWDYLLVNGIMITVEYLPGTHVEADHQSRFVTDSSKQKRICGYRSAVSPIMTQLALFLLGNMHGLVV